MADIKGIELASEIYGLEDETARDTATTASQTATTANQTATTASETATEANQKATTAGQTATEANEKIGNLANLKTSVKTNLVSAINEIVSDVPSRPIVKITTRKSSSFNTSELTAADLQAAGVDSLLGSYLVTVYRNTSDSQSYFIGWINASTTDIDACDFLKLAGAGDSLRLISGALQYSGGDSSAITTWIFNPIGDDNIDN